MRVLLNFLVELLNACLCLLSCSGLYIHVILGLGVSEAQHFPAHTFFFSLFFLLTTQTRPAGGSSDITYKQNIRNEQNKIK